MKLVVIGGTAAGLSAASKAKRLDPSIEVEVYEKSGYISYGACGLPYFIGDLIDNPDDLISLTPEKALKRGMTVKTKHEVTSIDRKEKTVTVKDLATGECFVRSYDKLMLATGARALRPDLGGPVHTLRTVEDGIEIKRQAYKARFVVIIGAGFIGLELSEELTNLGVKVTLVEMEERILPSLPEEYSAKILSTLRENQIEVRTGTSVASINADGTVTTSRGERLPADFVIAAIGVTPASELAREAGLELGLKGAVKVNSRMQTSDRDIYAAGDVAETRHLVTGKPCYVPLGTHANKAGRVAGTNIGGSYATFPGVLGSQVTKVFGLYIAMTGITAKELPGAVESSVTKEDKASYYPGGKSNSINLVFDRGSGRLLGAQAIGGESIAGRVNVLAAAITAGMTVSELNDVDFVYSPSVAPVYDPLSIAASQAMRKVRPNPSL